MKQEQDFFYFRPATQQKEMDTEDDVAFEGSNYDEDDILYSCPHNSEDYKPCSLLFIHQSFDQLEIMKR